MRPIPKDEREMGRRSDRRALVEHEPAACGRAIRHSRLDAVEAVHLRPAPAVLETHGRRYTPSCDPTLTGMRPRRYPSRPESATLMQNPPGRLSATVRNWYYMQECCTESASSPIHASAGMPGPNGWVE